jgi:hypothetical protein
MITIPGDPVVDALVAITYPSLTAVMAVSFTAAISSPVW